ncbi:uncharacterized protein LOC114277007 [Camellia sinensis]|uniref:uncharacterized protein LOC114277007 n=1 Tax=Camellia sinensis TaxID=4442 RepID=UPI00103680B8|nr:uncharacterized protein LOC114277007 [Camellia sinensis]
MLEDLCREGKLSTEQIRSRVLQNINSALESIVKNTEQFYLSDLSVPTNEIDDCCKDIKDESNRLVSELDLMSVSFLNTEQQLAYSQIVNTLLSGNPGYFFIDGPGGSGKTFLYRAILATIRTHKLIVLATATSGVVASLLPNGHSTHSWFKIHIDVERKICCNVSKQSGLAKLLKLTALIIWDEASMARRQSIESLDELLKDIMDRNGIEQQTSPETIRIPKVMFLPYNKNIDPLQEFITFVFSNFNDYNEDPLLMMNRAALTLKNDNVDHINEILIEEFPVDEHVYNNIDETVNKSQQSQYEDFLNSLSAPGLPPHKLFLKENCPILMLRNINPSKRLCNGTRLICHKFEKHVILTQIVVGD